MTTDDWRIGLWVLDHRSRYRTAGGNPVAPRRRIDAVCGGICSLDRRPEGYANIGTGRGAWASVLATLFAVAVSADEAADIVYRRETGKIGTGRKYVEPVDPTLNTVTIERLANLEGFDVVLSTRIGANIEPLSADILAMLAIKSAREAAPGKDGITYLMNAMRSGIVTSLTSAYEAAILAKSGARDLAAALAAVRPA